jgi:hypothetical protein
MHLQKFLIFILYNAKVEKTNKENLKNLFIFRKAFLKKETE